MESLEILVLAGGAGSRLQPLTRRLAKPAVPFAGHRLIDFTLGNCVHSGIAGATVLVQHRAASVEEHLRRSWRGRFDRFSPADAGREFRGTADAVRAFFERRRVPRRLLLLAGDHVYRMDYRPLIEAHERSGADATLSAVPVPLDEGRGFGILDLDSDGQVRAFVEKPPHPPAMPGRPDRCLASMGIYVFDGPALAGHLRDRPEETDFGHEVIPSMLAEGRSVAGRPFGAAAGERFWRDIADVDALHRAQMDLLDGTIEAPHGHPLPVEGGVLLGTGSRAIGAALRRTVAGRGVRVERGARLDECVLQDGVLVGAGARLRRCIVEEGARIAAGSEIGFDREHDARLRRVTPGGVVIVETAPEPAPA